MPDGLRTFAELAPDEKDRVSHRGKALAILAKALPGLMPELEAR